MGRALETLKRTFLRITVVGHNIVEFRTDGGYMQLFAVYVKFGLPEQNQMHDEHL